MRGKIDEIEAAITPKKKLPKFGPGDTVEVHFQIIEGDAKRVQVFEGIVIAVNGTGASRMMTVRKVVQGEGVERVFPLHSPRLVKLVVRKRGRVRRAKLYYLRERTGRAGRVEEVFAGREELKQEAAAEAKADAKPEAKPAEQPVEKK